MYTRTFMSVGGTIRNKVVELSRSGGAIRRARSRLQPRHLGRFRQLTDWQLTELNSSWQDAWKRKYNHVQFNLI